MPRRAEVDQVERAMLQGVIFDLDGVLLSTDELHYQSWREVATRWQLPFERRTFDRHLRGRGRADALAQLLAAAERDLPLTDRAALLEEKQACFWRMVEQAPPRPLPGTLELLAALERAGVPVAVGSSSRNARPLLERSGLTARFVGIVDGHGIAAKPDPAIYRSAARLLGALPAQCVAIEDARDGVTAAQAAGMPCLAIGPHVATSQATAWRADLYGLEVAELAKLPAVAARGRDT